MCNSKIVKKIESEHKIEKIERLEEKIKDKNNDIELVQEILDKELEDKERSLLEKKLSGFKAELFKLQADLKYI
jgi:protein subunit release factor A